MDRHRSLRGERGLETYACNGFNWSRNAGEAFFVIACMVALFVFGSSFCTKPPLFYNAGADVMVEKEVRRLADLGRQILQRPTSDMRLAAVSTHTVSLMNNG